MLERFPYDEHPGEHRPRPRARGGAGDRRDFAIKEMADRVVPDLGRPEDIARAHVRDSAAPVQQRMFANERHGAPEQLDALRLRPPGPGSGARRWIMHGGQQPGRPRPRLRVFARILVEDVSPTGTSSSVET